MKISACYITRNEERNLAKSLDSLHDQVDEIILVDTGSLDKTKEIAASFGACVYDFVWGDDFSAPRNFALDKASGDWIIFLDADEYIAPECTENIRSIVEKAHSSGHRGMLLIRRYDIDEDCNGEIMADTLVPRIYYHNPAFRYIGLVHEELREYERPILEQMIIPSEQLLLIHTGYSTRLSEAKAKRNLALLEKEMKAADNQERLYMYMADAYLGLGEKDQAEHYARLDIARGRQNTTYASRSYRILLQLSLEKGESASNRLLLCQEAVKDYPENPEFRADLAECLGVLGNYHLAAQEMRQALHNFYHYNGIEPMLMTTEDAENIKQRIIFWQERQKETSLSEIANTLQLLLLPLCCMEDDSYKKFAFKSILPKGFLNVLDRMHGGLVLLKDDDGKYFLDIMDVLLAKGKHRELNLLLTYVGDLSEHWRQKIIDKLEGQIQKCTAEEDNVSW